MKKSIYMIIVGVLVFSIAYSIIQEKTIEYTKIDHGVLLQEPEPEKGKLLTALFYIKNNTTRTVLIRPFAYTSCSYTGQIFSQVVVGHRQDNMIRLEPNETYVLQERTYVPRKVGLFTVEALGQKDSIVVLNSWVPNDLLLFNDEYCINKFVNITSSDGYEYWDISIGEIEYYPETIDDEYKLIRIFAAYTRWSGKKVYWKYAGIITEDLEIQYVRLAQGAGYTMGNLIYLLHEK